MQTLTQQETYELFESMRVAGYVQTFRKIAPIKMRLATPGEVIVTITNEKETSRTAKENEVVITNICSPYEEQQITSLQKAKELYFPDYLGSYPTTADRETLHFPKPEVRYAYEYRGVPIYITANWGETMPVYFGDFIQSLFMDGIDTNGKTDVYRVQKDIFGPTFVQI